MTCTFFPPIPTAEASQPVAEPKPALPPAEHIVNFAKQVMFWSDLSSSSSSNDADNELEISIEQPNNPIEHV